MSTDTNDATGGQDWSTLDLRRMDREEARETLPVAEYERWEQLHENINAAAETRERWAEEDQRVQELTVHADAEQLGTEVDLYGNTVLVHVNPDDDRFRAVATDLQDRYGEDGPDTDELDPEEVDRLADDLIEMLDLVILRWNGVEWDALDPDTRRDTLADARVAWGVDNLWLAWADIAEATQQRHQERVDVVDSFRGEARRGGR